MGGVHVIAGLDWDIAIRGILVVLVGVVVLPGSVYLLLGTNLGARLGFSVAAAGLFGFLTILTAVWWIQPPGIGPMGRMPSWRPVEIWVTPAGEEPSAPLTPVLETLPLGDALPSASEVIATAGGDLADQLPSTPTLGDIAAAEFTNDAGVTMSGEELLRTEFQLTKDEALDGWRLLSTADAGEPQTAADAILVEQGYFGAATEYKKLDVFETGGNPTLEDDCPQAVGEREKVLIPEDWPCRVWARIRKTFRLTAPPQYAVVQVQAVIPQEAVAGEPPPTPKVDEGAPIVNVLMVRDQGNVRAKPALWFFICASLFVFFILLLHFRDKKAWENREQKPVKAGA